MKDMNVPKMTAVDLPLFNGIVADLFPGIDTPVIDYGKVRMILVYFLAMCSDLVTFCRNNVTKLFAFL